MTLKRRLLYVVVIGAMVTAVGCAGWVFGLWLGYPWTGAAIGAVLAGLRAVWAEYDYRRRKRQMDRWRR